MPSEYRLQNLFFKTKFGWVLQGSSVISESRGLRWEDHRLDREPSRQALCCGQMNGWVKIPSIHIKALRYAHNPRVLEAEKEFLGKPVSKVSKTDKVRVQ